MERPTLLLLAVLALGCPGAPSADGDEGAIRDVLERYVEARNSANTAALAGLLHDDYDQSNLASARLQMRSKQERVEAYAEAFRKRTIERELHLDGVESLRLVTDEVALVDVLLSYRSPSGDVDFQNFVTYLLVKKDGRWLIRAARLAAVTQAG